MNTLTIDIRKAELQDAHAISAVHHDAWMGAYSGIIPHKALMRMVGRRGLEWWQGAIRRAANVIVAEIGGDVVGYATLGPSRMRSLPYKGEIYEIYVLPEYQGLGLGSRLFQSARRMLGDLRFPGLAVRALRDNDTAIGFYRRLGGSQVVETGERIGDTVLPVVVFGWDG